MTTLVDTSCLLRLPNPIDPRRKTTQDALDVLDNQGEKLVLARQNCAAFRGAATRPTAVNGLGFTPAEADAELDNLEAVFPPLPERASVYRVWRDLCRRAGVSGKQVHDTRLVAVYIVSGVQTILTWNPRDFVRFLPFVPGLTVFTPDEVLAVA